MIGDVLASPIHVDRHGVVRDRDLKGRMIGLIELTARKREPWNVIVFGRKQGTAKTRAGAVELAVQAGEAGIVEWRERLFPR